MKVLSKLTGVLAVTACVAAIGAAPANATLSLSINGSTVATDATNTKIIYSGTSGIWTIDDILLGTNGLGLGGDLFDNTSLDVSTTGTGSPLKLILTETDLTGASFEQFLSTFSATMNNISVTRSFYLDLGDTGAESILLGSTTGTNLSFLSGSYTLSGPFSITEEIDLKSTAPRKKGSKLSSDDDVTGIPVPEPLSLSLFGAGLLGFGAMRRRKARTVA